MAEILNNVEDIVEKDTRLIDLWGKRNPRFERKYEQSVLRIISDYGIGASENTGAKGKILGAGYEPYIMAFFIGLYANKKLTLAEDSSELKVLGQPLDKWGNLDSKKFRKAYSGLRSYIFAALVAKTDVDWIAVDKGEIKVGSAVTALVETMEKYANYGFSFMAEKLENDKGYFFSNRSFLDIFLQLTKKQVAATPDTDEVEEL